MLQPEPPRRRQITALMATRFSLMGAMLVNVDGANSNSVPSYTRLTLPSSYPTEVRMMDGTDSSS